METGREITPISIIRMFETTKEQRGTFVTQVVERLEDGTADPLETHLQVKCMEDVIKTITSNEKYRELSLTEAQKHGKSFTLYNAKFEVKETGTKYDFSKCADPDYAEMELQMAELKEKMKTKETFLKTVPISGMDVMFGDELIKVYPPAKSSTTSIAVTLK